MRINLSLWAGQSFRGKLQVMARSGQIYGQFSLFAQIIPTGKFNPSKFFFYFVSLEEVPTQAENLRE